MHTYNYCTINLQVGTCTAHVYSAESVFFSVYSYAPCCREYAVGVANVDQLKNQVNIAVNKIL